jgi:ribA/ribD-fused uncharacterized protein
VTSMIGYFDGTAYDFLSNFHPSRISWCDPWGRDWRPATVEHAYQAEKCKSRQAYIRVITARSPGEAKSMGQRVELRPDWEEYKFELMYSLVYRKFQIPKLKRLLLKTGDALLVEGNHWHDNIWGDCLCDRQTCLDTVGENHLGRTLMRVREALQ